MMLEKLNKNNTTTMNAERVIVAVFDLLGIRNAISKATPFLLKEIGDEIHNTMMTAQTDLMKNYKKISGVGIEYAPLEFLNLSDTFIIKRTMPSSLADNKNITALCSFFIQSAFTAYHFLKAGFPARGCIDVGYCYTINKIMTAQPFVNALEESEKLDFSGLIITNESLKMYNDIVPQDHQIVKTLPLYMPVKGGQIMLLNCIDWTCITTGSFLNTELSSDPIQRMKYLRDRFSAHNKSITDPSVRQKIINTERLIRDFIRYQQSQPANSRNNR